MVETGPDQWYMVDGRVGRAAEGDGASRVEMGETEGHKRGPYKVLEVDGKIRRYDQGEISKLERALTAIPTIGFATGSAERKWKYLRQQLRWRTSGRTGRGEDEGEDSEEEGGVCSWTW